MGGWGGGWTVAFSRPDKSKKERVVINVPKWPWVTGRPSPVTALKRGHLHNHPSHRHTQTQSCTLRVSVCVCMCLLVRIYMWIKQATATNCLLCTCMQPHESIHGAHKHVWHISDTVNGCTCIGHTSVPFHSSGSWTLTAGWVAQRDNRPLEEDI